MSPPSPLHSLPPTPSLSHPHSLSPFLFLSLSHVSPSIPRSLAPSLPRSLAPSLPRSLPRSLRLAPSLSRALASSLPRSLGSPVRQPRVALAGALNVLALHGSPSSYGHQGQLLTSQSRKLPSLAHSLPSFAPLLPRSLGPPVRLRTSQSRKLPSLAPQPSLALSPAPSLPLLCLV